MCIHHSLCNVPWCQCHGNTFCITGIFLGESTSWRTSNAKFWGFYVGLILWAFQQVIIDSAVISDAMTHWRDITVMLTFSLCYACWCPCIIYHLKKFICPIKIWVNFEKPQADFLVIDITAANGMVDLPIFCEVCEWGRLFYHKNSARYIQPPRLESTGTTERKWLTCLRQHFQLHFLEW